MRQDALEPCDDGGEDRQAVAAVIARLQNVLPKARTTILPGQQQMAMETAPDLVVSAVLDFRRNLR